MKKPDKKNIENILGPTSTQERMLFHYLEDPFVPGEKMYKSGDLARWVPGDKTNIEFLGRIAGQVKTRGFKIELEEIQSQLSHHEDIRESLVLAKEDEKGDKYICAYLNSHHEIPTAALREYLAKYFPEYMAPSFFVKLDRFPLIPNGKIDRKALPEPEIEVSARYKAPANEVEEKLVEIWADILEIEKEKISTEDDFFMPGGNSLSLVRVVSKIYNELQTQVPITLIFENPQIKSISNQVRADKIAEEKYTVFNASAGKKLFAFPPGNGYGITYSTLAHLIPNYCFYSFDFIEEKDRLAQYLEFLMGKVEEKVIKYEEYRLDLTELAVINARVHLITSESSRRFKLKHNWEKFTKKRIRHYDGHGNHMSMFSPKYLEKNTGIVRDILKKSINKKNNNG